MAQDDTDWKAAAKAVPELRLLRTLVTGLTVVMAVGMVTVVGLMWMRLSRPALPDLPAAIALPQGAQARAVTFSEDRIVVVTGDDRVLVYDRAGALVGEVALQP